MPMSGTQIHRCDIGHLGTGEEKALWRQVYGAALIIIKKNPGGFSAGGDPATRGTNRPATEGGATALSPSAGRRALNVNRIEKLEILVHQRLLRIVARS